MPSFTLNSKFLETFSQKEPDWGPLGEFVYMRTYSRIVDNPDGTIRKENFWETLKRVVEGCYQARQKYVKEQKNLQNEAQEMYTLMFNMKLLPPGRSLWMAGTRFVEKNGAACLNNCGFISTQNIDKENEYPFTWTMDALMQGVGIGFDTKGAKKIIIKEPSNYYEYKLGKMDNTLLSKHTIPDSREGWVDAFGLILKSFFLGENLYEFDFSQIREKGKRIKGFGGKSSGSGPLKKLLYTVFELLEKQIGEPIKSTVIVDIMNMIGVCVVSGNIRRSALLSLGDSNDKDFIEMKDYNLYPKEVKTHRWSSNNSIEAIPGQTDYQKIEEKLTLNGEPGIVWLDNCRKYGRMKDGITNADENVMGVNPCGEQSLESSELCNLVEVFPSRHNTYEEFENTLKYALIYGKTICLIPTHWDTTNEIIRKNRRLGISQTGIIDAFNIHGREEMLRWSDKGYQFLRSLDKQLSKMFGIAESIKLTTVKPSGSVSLLPGVSAGIHPPHSKYYIRRVRISGNGTDLLSSMEKAGYEIEPASNDKHTIIVSIPVHEKYAKKFKHDFTLEEQMINVIDYQREWSDNNISVTITFKSGEKYKIVYLLRKYDTQLKAISFLPLSDHGYVQAVYETISEDKYMKMVSKISKVDFSQMTAEPIGSQFCDGDVCVM